jgi:hypothetical protein
VKMPHIPFIYYSPSVLVQDRNSQDLVEKIYRTNKSISLACDELNVEFEEEMLGDLSACTQCGIWWHSHELIQDDSGNDLCRFCDVYYNF